MKKYNKYIFKKVLIPTFLTITTISFLLWLIQVIKFIPYVTERSLEFSVFMRMVFYVLPPLMLIIIPISLFISSIFIYNSLITENELVVLKGAGLNKFSLFKPLMTLAILLTAICYVLSLYLIPISERGYANIKEYAKKNYISLLLTEGEFNRISSEKITLYTKENKDGILREILLYDNRDNEKPSLITAKKGFLIEGKDDLIYLQMKNGSVSNFLKSTEEKESVLYFEDYTINLSVYYNNEEEIISYKTKALSTKDLINIVNNSSSYNGGVSAEFHNRMVMPLLTLILSMMSLGGLLYGDFNRRGNSKNIKITLVAGGLYLGSVIYITNSIKSTQEAVNNLYIYLTITFLILIFLLFNNRKINFSRKVRYLKSFFIMKKD